MSSRARRIPAAPGVARFGWDGTREVVESRPVGQDATVGNRQEHLAGLEREAFSQGYEQGEKAGLEAAKQRGDAMLRRLADTLAELGTARAEMIRQTERQIVELSLLVARKLVHREVRLDPEVLMAIVRASLERLGESAQVTVRLHPDEFEATEAARTATLAGSNVNVVADARVGRGGCRVESEMGMIDAGVDAQIQELTRSLLGEEQTAAEAVRVR
jgi:flagellar assembly protein FliH